MLKTHLKIFIRGFKKNPLISAINLLGLSFGLASGILVIFYVLDEVRYDKFHANKDRIYRVLTDVVNNETGELESKLETNGWPVAHLLKTTYPEVEEIIYTRNGSNLKISHNGERYTENVFYASEAFFKIFSFDLLEGDPLTALEKPYSIVITRNMEKKYFPGSGGLNKMLTLSDTLSFTVTGIVEEVPSQSHIQFDMLVSFSTYPLVNESFNYDTGWGNLNVRNYLMLQPNADVEQFRSKAMNIYEDNVGEWLSSLGMVLHVQIEPLEDIYLHSTYGNGFGPQGSADRVYLVGGVSLFVILLACINFINLSTARSVYRAKEIGLRKVVGSSRRSLISQILTESLLFTIGSFAIGIAITDLSLPFFNSLLGKEYEMSMLMDPVVFSGIIILIIVVTLLSGVYPALVISSLQPASILSGSLKTGSKGARLRKSLVVFQFIISAGLIITNFTVNDQLNFMRERDLGFSKDKILVLNARGLPYDVRNREAQTLQNELGSLSQVNSFSYTNSIPGRHGWAGQWAYPEGGESNDHANVEYISIDQNYIETLGLTLLAGRNIELERQTDIDDGLIINEAAVKIFGWETPKNAIGKRIESPSGHPAGEVIGVVKNYHQTGLQQHIGPIVMDYYPDASFYYAINYNPGQSKQLISEINTLWKKHFEGYNLSTFFLDDDFERQYQEENQLAKVFNIFSYLTIFIAMIGLLGMVSFMVASRKREIGVRKVLGANSFSVTKLLSRQFVVLVVLANLIAIPITWVLLSNWLEGFAYATVVSPFAFVYTLLLTGIVAIATVSYQTIHAAQTNPVEILRND